MTGVYIHDALRTPRGKAKENGGLAGLSPQELVRQQVDALAANCGDGVRIPDALRLGCVGQVDDQGGHIALVSKLHAELPDRAAAISLNNYCASGLTAIGQAAAMVASDQAARVLAGGVECMSRVPFMGDRASYYTDLSFPHRARYIPVVLAADRLANCEGITREELDAVALASQQRAAAAESEAALVRSRVDTGSLAAEECVRSRTDAGSLAVMPPGFGVLQHHYADALGGEQFEPLHTLGHAPPVCDGAALALIGKRDASATPRARILAYADCGGDPAASLTAGFTAMDQALVRAGLSLEDMDRIEFMESFSVTIAKFLRDRNPDPAKVNASGGHIAKGHPLGASGAILTSTLLDCLDAADGTLGLVVVTGASGTGAAMIVERIN